MPRPTHWPTKQQLEEERTRRNLRTGPFPFLYGFIRYVKQPDETYREELIYFNVTRPRTPEEEGVTNPFPVASSEFGRTFKVVGRGTPVPYDEFFMDPADFENVYLKEVS